MVASLSDLVMRHRGDRICLMGGGPSLEEDMKRVKADVFVSCNEHGTRVRPVDYVFCMDNIHTKHKMPMLGHLRRFTDAPIISPWHWGDYQMHTWPKCPKIFLSGVVGMWVAGLMGAHPLILAGFDCYGGDKATVDQHKAYVPHLFCDVRVVSGPLVDVWQPYKPGGRRPAYNPPDVMSEVPELADGIKVKAVKPWEFRGHLWPAGTVLSVPRHEVWRQIKHKSLVEV